MVIRLRIYESQDANHEAADRVFYELVKPIHERHGAQFLGRYRDEEGRVIVMWSYFNADTCRRIQQAVADDPATIENAQRRREAGLHGKRYTEHILTSTSLSDGSNESAVS